MREILADVKVINLSDKYKYFDESASPGRGIDRKQGLEANSQQLNYPFFFNLNVNTNTVQTMYPLLPAF